MRMKFKTQLKIALFAAVNYLNGQTLTGSKGHGFWFSIPFVCFCVSKLFQWSLLVIVIMIDGREKRNCEGSFGNLEFACLWKAQKWERTISNLACSQPFLFSLKRSSNARSALRSSECCQNEPLSVMPWQLRRKRKKTMSVKAIWRPYSPRPAFFF